MKFIIFGDSKGKDNGINKKVLNSLLKSSKKYAPSPDFIVICGDSIAGSKDPKLLKLQLEDFNSIINKHYPSAHILPVIGNHEVNINPTDDRFEKIFASIYDNMIPESNCLVEYNKTVYFLDFSNIRIIVLNSFHYGEIQKVSEIVLNWLKEITADCTKKKLLFIHSPLFPTGAHLGHCLDLYTANRDDLLVTIEECSIDAVFCGHEHNYSRRLINKTDNLKDLYQIITGGAGEKLRDKYKSKKDVIVAPIAEYHYLVADSYDDYIKITAINIKCKILDQFIIE